MRRFLWVGCLWLTLWGAVWAAIPQDGYSGYLLTAGLTGDHLVIDNAAGFTAFQTRLPQSLPSQTRPAPDNPDPMRRSEYARLGGRWLLVWSQSIYREVVLESVGAAADGTVVVKLRLEAPADSEMYARPYDWGRYRLVPIPVQGAVRVSVRSVDRK